MTVAQSPLTEQNLKSSITAAILLLAHTTLRCMGAYMPGTAEGVIDLAGCSRSQAYHMLSRLVAACESIHDKPGRPPTPCAPASDIQKILQKLLSFLMENPGAVSGRAARRTYSDGFRSLVCQLTEPGSPAEKITVEELVEVTGIPLGTLKNWLNPKPIEVSVVANSTPDPVIATTPDLVIATTPDPVIATTPDPVIATTPDPRFTNDPSTDTASRCAVHPHVATIINGDLSASVHEFAMVT
jgi:hypothetical protein